MNFLNMKKKIKNALWRVGIDVRKAKSFLPIDFTDEDIDPLSAFYQASGKPFYIQVPIKNCRHDGVMSFRTDHKSPSPYIRTLVEYKNGSSLTYLGSWIEKVHSQFKPQSAASRMGIENPSYKGLEVCSAWGGIMPWEAISPQQMAEVKSFNIARENKEKGANTGEWGGHNTFGPTSREKGELEFSRLVNTFNSIKNIGFYKEWEGKASISAIILYSRGDKEIRYLCRSGHHRLSALAALGWHYVELQIQPHHYGGIIRREDVDYWPTVRNGYLTREEALTLFDRFYEGEPPIAFKRAMNIDVDDQS